MLFEQRAYVTDGDVVELEQKADKLMDEMAELDKMLTKFVNDVDKVLINPDHRKELSTLNAQFAKCEMMTAEVLIRSEKVKRKHIKVTRLPKIFIKGS